MRARDAGEEGLGRRRRLRAAFHSTLPQCLFFFRELRAIRPVTARPQQPFGANKCMCRWDWEVGFLTADRMCQGKFAGSHSCQCPAAPSGAYDVLCRTLWLPGCPVLGATTALPVWMYIFQAATSAAHTPRGMFPESSSMECRGACQCARSINGSTRTDEQPVRQFRYGLPTRPRAAGAQQTAIHGDAAP